MLSVVNARAAAASAVGLRDLRKRRTMRTSHARRINGCIKVDAEWAGWRQHNGTLTVRPQIYRIINLSNLKLMKTTSELI